MVLALNYEIVIIYVPKVKIHRIKQFQLLENRYRKIPFQQSFFQYPVVGYARHTLFFAL